MHALLYTDRHCLPLFCAHCAGVLKKDAKRRLGIQEIRRHSYVFCWESVCGYVEVVFGGLCNVCSNLQYSLVFYSNL